MALGQLSVPDNFLMLPRVFGIEDDFLADYVTGDRWTATLTDSGSATLNSEKGGTLTLAPSDGTVADNDEAYLGLTAAPFLFANNKPCEAIARLTWAEANTDDANVLFGFISTSAANMLLDDGGGPPASYTGAVFFKVDGGTAWWFETSLAGTQTTTLLNYATPNHATTGWQSLKIQVRSRGSTVLEFIPYIDTAGGQGYVQCVDTNGAKVKHTMTLGSPAQCKLAAGVKNGGANNEALKIDYMAGFQTR